VFRLSDDQHDPIDKPIALEVTLGGRAAGEIEGENVAEVARTQRPDFIRDRLGSKLHGGIPYLKVVRNPLRMGFDWVLLSADPASGSEGSR
jgi:hypothetical protein